MAMRSVIKEVQQFYLNCQILLGDLLALRYRAAGSPILPLRRYLGYIEVAEMLAHHKIEMLLVLPQSATVRIGLYDFLRADVLVAEAWRQFTYTGVSVEEILFAARARLVVFGSEGAPLSGNIGELFIALAVFWKQLQAKTIDLDVIPS